MLSCSFMLLSLLSQPGQVAPKEPPLFSHVQSNGQTVVYSLSEKSPDKRGRGVVITLTVRNYKAASPCEFKCVGVQGSDTIYSGSVPAARQPKAGAGSTPGVMTQQANTYRQIGIRPVGMEYKFPWVVNNDGSASMVIWVETGSDFFAKPGRTLFASLIDGEKDGKELVNCSCTVTEVKPGEFKYEYTLKNTSDQELSFRWAGFEGKVAPGRSFAHSVKSGMVTKEVRSPVEVSLESRGYHLVKMNIWEKP